MEEVQRSMPESQPIAPKSEVKVPIVALIAAGVLMLEIGVATALQYVNYSNAKQGTAVLGATSTTSCGSVDIQKQMLEEQKRTISLYAPDKTLTFPVSAVSQCITVAPCGRDAVQCKASSVTVSTTCISDYLNKNSTIGTTTKLVTGEGREVQVRREDWTVNVQTLAEQLQEVLKKGISACDFVEGAKVRANLGTIQLSVSDAVPAVTEKFAEKFVEIDKSMGKIYLWNKGVFQVLPITKIGNVPVERIYKRQAIDFSRFTVKADSDFLSKNTDKEVLVIIHE